MKIATYEAIFDRTIEMVKISGWVVLYGAGVFAFLLAILLLINIMTTISISFDWLYHLVPAAVIISIPITLFSCYYRIARVVYRIKRFRDFWFGFSTYVKIDYDEAREKSSEIEKWLTENLRYMHKERNTGEYLFASKSDAVAFKLAWC